jgi:hypothetical protein
MGREFKVKLQPYQDDFIFCQQRYPAFIGGWGTGKSLSAIIKAINLSKEYPDNLGLVVRREFTNLRDSTLKDFYSYTGIAVSDQKKEAKIGSSVIIFRHGDELGPLQNINLGWFWYEQAEEAEDNGQAFDMLCGRLRRGKHQTGFITGNATEESHWVYKYWKEGKDPATFPLFEADSFKNAEHLPKETIVDWRRLEERNPAIYKRYVLNQWGIGSDQFVLIPYAAIDALKSVVYTTQAGKGKKCIISCDPSQGGDECVAWVMEDGAIIDQGFYHEKDLMVIVGHLMLTGAKHKISNYAIDTIGIGQGVASRLNELVKKDGGSVEYINSAEASTNPTCNNRRTEMWWYLSEQIRRGLIPYPEDAELRRQLSSVRYKVVNSNGLIALEPKEITKKRLGCSPDRADAFVYAVWGLQSVKPPAVKESQYRWKDKGDSQGYMSV